MPSNNGPGPVLVWNPQPPKNHSPQIPLQEWDKVKDFITERYWVQNRPMSKVRLQLVKSGQRLGFSFTPTENQLITQARKWGLYKYNTENRGNPRNLDDIRTTVSESQSPPEDAKCQAEVADDLVQNQPEKQKHLARHANFDNCPNSSKRPSKRVKLDPDPDSEMAQSQFVERLNQLSLATNSLPSLLPEPNSNLKENNDHEILYNSLGRVDGLTKTDNDMMYAGQSMAQKENVESSKPEMAPVHSHRRNSSLTEPTQILCAELPATCSGITPEKLTDESLVIETNAYQKSSATRNRSLTNAVTPRTEHNKNASPKLEKANNLTDVDHTDSDQLTKYLRRAGDYFLNAGILEEAFQLYCHLYLHTLTRNHTTNSSNTTDDLVEVFIDMARSAVSPKAQKTMRKVCKTGFWKEILCSRPRSLALTVLVMVLNDLGFRKVDNDTYHHLSEKAEEYRKASPRLWRSMSKSWFSLIYVNLKKKALHQRVALEDIKKICGLILCTDYFNVIQRRVSEILDYLCKMLDSPTADDWCKEIPQLGWTHRDSIHLRSLKLYLLYCLLCRAYEHLMSQTQAQTEEDSCTTRAKDAFGELERSYNINVYAIIRSLVKNSIAYRDKVLTPSDASLRNGNLISPKKVLVVGRKMLKCLRDACWGPNGYNAMQHLVFTIVTITPVKTFERALEAELYLPTLRHFVPNKEHTNDYIGAPSENCFLHVQDFQRPEDKTLLSSASSNVSEFSNFRETTTHWRTTSGTYHRGSTLPSAGFKNPTPSEDSWEKRKPGSNSSNPSVGGSSFGWGSMSNIDRVFA